MYIKRNLKNDVVETLEYAPVVLINGARQSGKSTFAKEMIQEGKLTNYITMDDPGILSKINRSPIDFLENLPTGTVIDEVQKIPELFSAIKYVVDNNRVPGRFLLTGSANILLLPKLADSLAGRIAIHTLMPFSVGEFANKKEDFIDWLFSDDFTHFKVKEELTNDQLFAKIASGSYPEILTSNYSENNQTRWYNDYINTLLIRDIRDMSDISGLNDIPALLSVLAARTGGVLNTSDISRSIDIPNTTLKRYLNLLHSLYLVNFLKPWSTNFGKRLVKSPKIYLNDTGFCLHLLEKNQESLAQDRVLFGHILENFIILEIQKQITWSLKKPSMYYLRTQDKKEIDLILESRGGQIIAIEIKASSNFKMDSVDNIKEFAKAVGDKFHRGIVFYTGNQVHRLSDNIYALPIQTLWEERVGLGGNISKSEE
jgi:uncharacterized protein